LLREFGSPEGVFRASLTALGACNLAGSAAQAVFKKQNFGERKRSGGAAGGGREAHQLTGPSTPDAAADYDPP